MQAFSCASGAGCALTRDHESRRGRKSPGGDWREAPFRPCEQARGRKGDSAPTLRVFPARRTRNPACGGTRKRPLRGLHEKDGPAPFHHKECGGGATALHGALGQYLQPLFRVGRRPFRVPAKRGVRVRQAMGLEESRRDGAAKGGVASRPPPLPTRTGAAGPSRRRFSWSRAAPPHHFSAKPQRTQRSQRIFGARVSEARP